MRLQSVLHFACVVGLGWLAAGSAYPATGPLVISEFLASNSQSFADENGDFEDWIEIRNVSASPVNAAGWSLTDNADNPTKWMFPSINVPAGAFLVVFASGKDRRTPGAPLHTNFRLEAAGEYLGLFLPDGETASTEFAPQFPPQASDQSFGFNSVGELRFFQPPTPGAANGVGFVDRVADTRFSVDRGFHDRPVDVVISCATPGVEIRWTTNGTPPTASTGFVYDGPIRISGTTSLRAAAYKAGWLPSNVDTHTYLFTADIIGQSPTGAPPPGWPTSWGSNVRDYGMDPDVVNDPRYRDTIQDDLKTLPSFCVTMHLPDLFNSTRGIYANPGQDGRDWERPMSLELVYPDGRSGFQVDGGIRIRGGFSRSTQNPKHAFRFFFRNEYGPGKLRYPLFGDAGTDEFDGFDLRTFQNYSWSFQNDARGTFLRDQFNRDVQLAMGHQGERGDFYHLYINGHYWGLFNTCERPEASYAATYFGGNKEDYDVFKVEAGPYTINATDGTLAGWTALYNLVRSGTVDDALYHRVLGLNPDGTRNPNYPVYVDPVNLIDYMLIILWGGNLDAPISNFLSNQSPNNFFGIWNRVTADRGFQFFVHDAEHTLLNVNESRIGPYPAGNASITKSNPQWLWQRLLGSPEFRQLVADRIQRHFFQDGALTAAKAREIYLRRRDEIDRAVVAESARWGDAKRAVPFTRDTHWVSAVQQNLDFIARRPAIVLQQLRSANLVPSLSAPQFNQAGGPVPPGFGLLMAPAGAAIYYTVDGTDPRRPGGAIAASARRYSTPVPLTESVLVKARAYSDGNWSALNEAEFTLIQTFRELFITEIHYHPTGTEDRDGDDFEFLELKNVGPASLDVGGVHFTEGIRFRFPNGTRLEPGAFAVLVRNATAFASRYPTVRIAGVYEGRLSNSGERLTLHHAVGTPLFTIAYGTSSPWPRLADGGGFSLVPRLANLNPAPDEAVNWRASSRAGGSPGADDPADGLVTVVVNEVLTHTDPPLVDAVELHNPNDVPAPIGGWWLTDDRRAPNKFRVPAGTTIAPRGFLTFSEPDFNTPPSAPGSFSFSSYGEEVWIFSADAAGELTGYSDGFSFKAASNGVSFGRHTNSVGTVSFPPQIRPSFDLPNVGPRLSPVVINEIHYHPPAGDAEFLEIRNLTGETVPLYDPLAPTNTWRLAGVGFAFPPGASLAPGGYAVVSALDPSAFRAQYGVPAEVPVFGPWPGVLQDGGETLALERPETPDLLPDGTWFVPYVALDTVRYDSRPPWPLAAAGGGASLERRAPVQYADDPAAWRASVGEPSPGTNNDGNRAPTVVAGPDREVESALFPYEVQLEGSGRDDGLPIVPGKLTFHWTQVDGPGVVDFRDPSRSNAVVRLPGTGAFTLRLTATDGDRSHADTITLQVRRPSEQQTLVPAGSLWRYLDNGSDPGTAWRQPGFNDAAWSSGRAQLGFGDGDEATTLRRTIGGRQSIAYYFRRTFTVADPAAVTALAVRLLRDDGALVFLNGQLVFRSNMPEIDVDQVTSTTLASNVVGDAEESAFFEQAVDPALLTPGVNTLAVQVHQVNSTSSDISFDLALDAWVTPANRRPTVGTGPDRTVRAGEPATIVGAWADDGLPNPPGVARFAWTQVEGPAPAMFAATNQATTTVIFPMAGHYALRITVDDGALTDTSDVAFEVTSDDYGVWRSKYFSTAELADPAVSGDNADPDGDGQGNRQEYLSGTDPREPASVLRLEVARKSDGSLGLKISVVAGRSYTVLRQSALGDGAWQAVQSLDTADCDCEVEVVDPGPPTAEPRYYRVVTPRVP